MLTNDLVKKHKTKAAQEKVYTDLKDQDWTFYTSIKRQMMKKQNSQHAKLGMAIR